MSRVSKIPAAVLPKNEAIGLGWTSARLRYLDKVIVVESFRDDRSVGIVAGHPAEVTDLKRNANPEKRWARRMRVREA